MKAAAFLIPFSAETRRFVKAFRQKRRSFHERKRLVPEHFLRRAHHCGGIRAHSAFLGSRGRGEIRSLPLRGHGDSGSISFYGALRVCLREPGRPVFLKLLSLPARLFRLPGNCGGILLASLIGGYPSAAKCAGDYYKSGLIDRETAERLLTFCVNAGPPFLLFAVGQAAFGSVRTGALLWISQLASSVVIGLLGALFAKKPARTSDTGPFSGRSAASSATHAVIAAADACFTMCAFITAACALTELFDAGTLSGLFLRYPVSRVLFDGLLRSLPAVRRRASSAE
jgi:hypothetical protein